LIYDAVAGVWENAFLTDGTGVSITEGAGTITVGLASGYGDTLNPYASKTANYVLASPNGSAGVPTFRALVAADVPTLNQNTTGSAATLTTPRAIYGNNFDGSAALTQVIASTYGGTGNGFTKFTGATTAERTYTLPDASSTIVVQGGALGTPSSGTVTNLTGTASININGTVGATTPAAGTFTSLSDSGNLTFTGTGNRITGDFSNATIANRVAFQTSTVNGNTTVHALPNGTATISAFRAFNNSDPTNASYAMLYADSTTTRLDSTITGTGTYLPMTFFTGGTEKLRIAADATGTYTFGGTAPRITGDFSNATVANRVAFQTSTANGNTVLEVIPNGTGNVASILCETDAGLVNTSFAQVLAATTEISFRSGIRGTGTYQPMTFQTGGIERVRIDTSGNVGIGISPATKLDVLGTIWSRSGGSSGAVAALSSDATSGANGITLEATFTTGGYGPIKFKTNNAERMRIDSSGNLLMASTGEVQFFTSSYGIRASTGLEIKTGDFTRFLQGTTEYARIDSSGNLLVGATNSSVEVGVGVKLGASATIPYVSTVFNTAGAANTYLLYNTNATNNGYRFYVASNGGVVNYSGNNVNLSDERTKTNIILADSYLDKICAIPVKLFNYKDEAEGEQRTLGVIAQDVEAVAPEFVNNDGWKGTEPEDGVPLKTIYTTDMMFGLMKAIQEQQALITTLTDRITALEKA
jgi:hypothetical protein